MCDVPHAKLIDPNGDGHPDVGSADRLSQWRPHAEPVTAGYVAPTGMAPSVSLARRAPPYLGTYSANPFSPDSIANPYGRYGNPYSPDSVNNPYGRFGSPYSPDSATNPYALTPPLIFGGQ